MAAAAAAAERNLWSHMETLHLIDAYEERWLAMKRGHLRAHQWDAVAAAVAARCGLAASPVAKSATQCRHKIEKLRKRYRADRLRPARAAWPYFDRMERLEHRPLPSDVRQPLQDDEQEDDDGGREGEHSRSTNGIVNLEANWPSIHGPRTVNSQKGGIFTAEEEEEEEEEEDEEGAGGVVSQIAAVVRRFGDGMMRLESTRMEMMRQMERDWMEMEAKRLEMMVESERCLVEMIAGTFSGPVKRPKRSHCGEFVELQEEDHS